ncbi:unnamed protein product [Clonostachys byssicola]|uniref:Uncharacterized protein n=1 Tax=Clonostachys byssicola TaxID=160290 RepID=A0A9N9UFV0_9HYPO|nr:unnamed protein product [Clonostachys byssicola]
MQNPSQAPEKADPLHVSGPSQQYVYDPSRQQYVQHPSLQQQVYDSSQPYPYDSSQPYIHYPSQLHLLDPQEQHPAPAYSAENPHHPSGQGYNGFLGPYPSGPGPVPLADKPSHGFDGIQQGQHPAQTTRPGATAAIKRRGRGLLTNPRKWSLKKKLIVAVLLIVVLVLVIAVPAGLLLNRKRKCKCPGWYDRKNNYFPATYYPCDGKGKDLNTNRMPSSARMFGSESSTIWTRTLEAKRSDWIRFEHYEAPRQAFRTG